MPRDSAGNPVASFGRAKLNDEIRASGKHAAVNPKSRSEGHQPDPDATMEESEKGDIKEVVAAHGPAEHIERDHAGDGFKTVSHHGDFKHSATHDNVHTAQLHAFHAHGSPHPEPTEASIEDHVAEHGPAHHVVHHHDEESGSHHVSSHHGDGNVPHHSVHDSHEAAYAHMGKAMGVGVKDQESAGPEAAEREGMAEAGIPGMTA